MGAAKAELPDCHQQQRPQLQPDGTDRTMTGGGISSGLLRTMTQITSQARTLQTPDLN